MTSRAFQIWIEWSVTIAVQRSHDWRISPRASSPQTRVPTDCRQHRRFFWRWGFLHDYIYQKQLISKQTTDGWNTPKYTKSIIEQQSYDSYQLFYLYTYIFLGHPNYKIGHLILMELFVNHVTFSLIPDAYIEPSFQHWQKIRWPNWIRSSKLVLGAFLLQFRVK